MVTRDGGFRYLYVRAQLALGAFSSYDTAPAPVFKGLPSLLIHCHPGSFFSIIDGEFGRSNESAGECAAREKPTKLDAEEQKEAVDVTRKVVRLSVRRMGMWMW
jgi:hypothetical protein